MFQLVSVSLATAVVGDVLAVSVVKPCLDVLTADRGAEPLPAVINLSTIVFTNAVCALFLVVGGVRQAGRAAKKPPEVPRARTVLIPGRSVTSYIARKTVIGKGAWLSQPVVPVMMAMGLCMGIGAIGQSINATFKANNIDK